MKIASLEVMRSDVDDSWWVPGGCQVCGGILTRSRGVPRGVEHPVTCEACGAEHGVTIVRNPDLWMCRVRRPYGCADWEELASSNLRAAGTAGTDLVVAFRKGGIYRYPGAADLFPELLAAESAGKFFHARIRPRETVRLCAIYGCANPAHREQNQVLCLDHLAPKGASG